MKKSCHIDRIFHNWVFCCIGYFSKIVFHSFSIYFAIFSPIWCCILWNYKNLYWSEDLEPLITNGISWTFIEIWTLMKKGQYFTIPNFIFLPISFIFRGLARFQSVFYTIFYTTLSNIFCSNCRTAFAVSWAARRFQLPILHRYGAVRAYHQIVWCLLYRIAYINGYHKNCFSLVRRLIKTRVLVWRSPVVYCQRQTKYLCAYRAF